MVGALLCAARALISRAVLFFHWPLLPHSPQPSKPPPHAQTHTLAHPCIIHEVRDEDLLKMNEPNII